MSHKKYILHLVIIGKKILQSPDCIYGAKFVRRNNDSNQEIHLLEVKVVLVAVRLAPSTRQSVLKHQTEE